MQFIDAVLFSFYFVYALYAIINAVLSNFMHN